jgi:hypothetical protein
MVFDRALPFQQQMIKQFQFDGRKFFACYDTDELIGFE